MASIFLQFQCVNKGQPAIMHAGISIIGLKSAKVSPLLRDCANQHRIRGIPQKIMDVIIYPFPNLS